MAREGDSANGDTSFKQRFSVSMKELFGSGEDHGESMRILRTNSKNSNSKSASSAQEFVATILDSRIFEYTLASVVALNMVAVVVETDMDARHGKVEMWLKSISMTFLGFYCVELTLKLFVFRLGFFKKGINVFELLLVTSDLAALALEDSFGSIPAFSLLRVFRLMRLLRAVRLMVSFRELYMILNGMIGAFRAVAWAVVMIGLLLTLFSVVAVELIHPVNVELWESDRGVAEYGECDRCKEAFSTVYNSNLTLFQQIMLGDDWTTVALPILNEYPVALLFFIPVWVIVQLGLLNLILTVIMEQAEEAREADVGVRLALKQKALKEAKNKLAQLWENLDADGDGMVSKGELVAGYQEHQQVRDTLSLMDVGPDDLDMVFCLLDRDKSGHCSYKEFIDELYKMKAHDLRALLMFTKADLVSALFDMRQQQEVVRSMLFETEKMVTKMSDPEWDSRHGVGGRASHHSQDDADRRQDVGNQKEDTPSFAEVSFSREESLLKTDGDHFVAVRAPKILSRELRTHAVPPEAGSDMDNSSLRREKSENVAEMLSSSYAYGAEAANFYPPQPNRTIQIQNEYVLKDAGSVMPLTARGQFEARGSQFEEPQEHPAIQVRSTSRKESSCCDRSPKSPVSTQFGMPESPVEGFERPPEQAIDAHPWVALHCMGQCSRV